MSISRMLLLLLLLLLGPFFMLRFLSVVLAA
jgi:hypothetical protein